MSGKPCKSGCTCGRHYTSPELREKMRQRLRGRKVTWGDAISRGKRGSKRAAHRDGCNCSSCGHVGRKCEDGCLCGRHSWTKTWTTSGFSGRHHQASSRARIGASVSKAYAEGRHAATQVQPNLWELKLLDVLEDFGFRYTGDGSHRVMGKQPDFWDGGTQLIELYGEYWHEGDDPQERINFFKQHGYACLVIWGKELQDLGAIKGRVKEFVS